MSDSVRPHRRQPTRLPHHWDSPGKNTGVGCHFLLQCRKAKSESEVAQSCPTLSDPMDYSLSGSSIHGIFQARVLEWVAISTLPSSSKSEENNSCTLLIKTMFLSQIVIVTQFRASRVQSLFVTTSLCQEVPTILFLPLSPATVRITYPYNILVMGSFVTLSQEKNYRM